MPACEAPHQQCLVANHINITDPQFKCFNCLDSRVKCPPRSICNVGYAKCVTCLDPILDFIGYAPPMKVYCDKVTSCSQSTGLCLTCDKDPSICNLNTEFCDVGFGSSSAYHRCIPKHEC